MLLEISRPLLVVIIAVGALVLTAGFILLFIYVLLPNSYKKQVRALEKRFSYLDSLLIGTVSQYIYRIEIISRNNLLYIDKHETFSHRYKAILDTEDKYSESMIKQLNSLIANKKFKNIKAAINEAKKALNIFDENLSSLYNDLKAVIQLEEDCRKQIDTLKETYRRVKQTYYAESAELEMVAKTFNKLFARIDETFTELDKLIESAEYDEINDQLPELEKVLNALGKALLELPNLCALTKTVVTEKIAQIQVKYAETEKKGVPLYHLGFKGQVEDWKKRLDSLTKRIINLQCSGVQKECDLILAEINRVSKQLDDEIAAKAYFKENYEDVYRKVKDVRNTFIKIHSMIPNIEKIYMISNAQKDRIAELFTAVTNLDNSKKNLDSFYMSGVRQPFSLLKNQLDELKANYEVVAAGVEEFKNYIESLKSTAEDAYKMIFVYYARIKEIEKVLADINIQDLRDSYQEKINAIYEILNYIYDTIQSKPINVEEIANKIEQLKNVSNALFEEIDDKSRHCYLAENLLVSLNSMAKEQDVAQSLEQLEAAFMKGEFESVYRQADAIYRSKIASDHE